MEQFEKVEVVKALKKHTEKIRELTDKQFKASQALDMLVRYKSKELNVNTTRDIDQFVNDVLGVPFLSEHIINSLYDMLQYEKRMMEKQMETYVKKLDMDLSTVAFEQHEGGMSLVVDGKGIGHVIANVHTTANELAKQALEEAKLNGISFNEPHKMTEITSKKDEEYKKLQEEHDNLKKMYQTDVNQLFKQNNELTRENETLTSKYNVLNDNFMKYKSIN